MKKLLLTLCLIFLLGCPPCPPGTPPGHPGKLCIPQDTITDMISTPDMAIKQTCCVPCQMDSDCVSSLCPEAKDYGKCVIIGVRSVGTCKY